MKFKKTILVMAVLSLFQSFLLATPKNIKNLSPADAKKMPTDRPSVALVLAGGGAKGFIHLPILEYIEQIGIPIDMIIGTSIGSIIGGIYSAGYTAQDIVNEFSSVDWTPMFSDVATTPYEDVYDIHSTRENPLAVTFGSDFSLKLGSGISNGQNVYELMKELTLRLPSDMDFDDLHIPFRAVTTDMLTGDAYVVDEGDLADAMRASMSLPAVFEPVYIDDIYMVDGGLRYNLAINVAQKMGFDIIIGIDISQQVRDNPDTFTSNPAVAIMNTITIGQKASMGDIYDMATLIIKPDVSKFGLLDFKKAWSIYNSGKKELENYKEQLNEIRKMIYPDDYDSNGNRISTVDFTESSTNNYIKLPNPVISEIQICGAYKQDEKYILNNFKHIQNKELSRSSYEQFMNSIYLTGNYKTVKPRILHDKDNYYLKLELVQKEPVSYKLLIGLDLEQVIADTKAITTDLELDLQFRGLTGIGSMIALHGSFLTDFGGEFYFMQPFNPYVFIDTTTFYFEDRYSFTGNNINTFSNSTSYQTFGSNLNLGLRTLGGNLVKFGVFYRGLNTSCSTYDMDYKGYKIYSDLDLDPTSSLDLKVLRHDFGVNTTFTLSSLDSEAFAHDGFYINSNLSFHIPLNKDATNINPFLLIEKAEAKAVLPLGKNICFGLSGLFGMEFLGNFESNYALVVTEGFSTYDRIYFPSITNKRHYGSNTAVAKATLQLKPTEHLTIFGGDLFFRLEGTAGILNYDWKTPIYYYNETTEQNENPLLWSGTFGVGLRIKSGFNILARVGVGSTYESNLTPMFTLDIGNYNF